MKICFKKIGSRALDTISKVLVTRFGDIFVIKDFLSFIINMLELKISNIIIKSHKKIIQKLIKLSVTSKFKLHINTVTIFCRLTKNGVRVKIFNTNGGGVKHFLAVFKGVRHILATFLKLCNVLTR